MVKIVAYFTDPKNTLYPDFSINVDIVNESLKHVLRKKEKKSSHKKSKNSKNIKDENITMNDFHAFIPVLLLFQKLFKVFDCVDSLIVSDQRILKGEFMKIRKNLDKIDEFQVIDPESITEEHWLNAWNEINVDNNDFISFHEACEYTLNHVHSAFKYEHKDVDEMEEAPTEESSNEPTIILGPAATERAATEPAATEPVPAETSAEPVVATTEPVPTETSSEPVPSEA